MRITLKIILMRAAVIGIVLTIILYAYYQSRAIISGPQLLITSPVHGETTTTSLIHVTGTAIHAKEITLQGRPIFIDLEGNFTEELLLLDGYNIIELTATDVQGRQVRKTLELTYDAPQENITL